MVKSYFLGLFIFGTLLKLAKLNVCQKHPTLLWPETFQRANMVKHLAVLCLVSMGAGIDSWKMQRKLLSPVWRVKSFKRKNPPATIGIWQIFAEHEIV